MLAARLGPELESLLRYVTETSQPFNERGQKGATSVSVELSFSWSRQLSTGKRNIELSAFLLASDLSRRRHRHSLASWLV